MLVLLKFYCAPDIVEFVLGRFSHFYIAIAYSNSTFCGAWTPSFCEPTCKLKISAKRAHPRWTLISSRTTLFEFGFCFWWNEKLCWPTKNSVSLSPSVNGSYLDFVFTKKKSKIMLENSQYDFSLRWRIQGCARFGEIWLFFTEQVFTLPL